MAMAAAPRYRDGESEGLAVFPGGRLVCPRLLVVDVDDDALLMPFSAGSVGANEILIPSSDEVQAFSCAVNAGLEIVTVAAFNAESAVRMRELLRCDVTVLADGPLNAACSTAERGQLRLKHLSSLCRARGVLLRDIAVVAVRPEDRLMMLEAGVAFALETAGYDTCTAADAVFPPRRHGGLAAAIDVVATLRMRPPDEAHLLR